jgi:hypothetical protein
MHPGLEIPFNPFPRKNAEARQRTALERSEIEAVLAAARSDIDASWVLFSEGERALAGVDRAAIALEPDLAHLDLNDLGTFLAVIVDRFGRLVPPQRTIHDAKMCGRSSTRSSIMATPTVSLGISTRSRKR